MQIPDFLKRENAPMVDDVYEEFDRVLKEYEKVFGSSVTTECHYLSWKEWTELLRICIKENKTYEELTGDILEDGDLI